MDLLNIRAAEKSDALLILSFIKKLADYEKLSHEVTATVENIENTIFSDNSNVRCILGYVHQKPVSFAIFFNNYSTFLGKKGIYLEDLFVLPEERGKGFGKQMLEHLAQIAVSEDCGRLEWSVLDWNESAIKFYENLGAKLKNEWIINRLSGKELINLAQNKQSK